MTSRASDIVGLLRGRHTAAQLAARYGVTEADVLAWKDLFLAGLEARPARVSRRWLKSAAVGAVVLSVGALLTTRAWAAGTCAQTLPSPLVTLCPNEPALASEVNGNFNQLVTWIQNKVGTVGVSGITAGSVSAAAITASSVVTAGVITSGGNLTSNGTLSVASNATVGGRLTVTGNLTVQGTALGAYTSLATGTTYTAATDGFVVVGMVGDSNGSRCYMHGIVDGTVRTRGSLHYFTNSDVWVNDDGMSFPVRKGSTWNVLYVPTSGTCTVNVSWVALNP